MKHKIQVTIIALNKQKDPLHVEFVFTIHRECLHGITTPSFTQLLS